MISVHVGLIFTERFYVTTFDNNTSKLIEQQRLIISLKSEMLWGVGTFNNFQYVMASVDGYRPGKM